MKRVCYILIFILSFALATFSQDYYWYNGKKISLLRGNQRYILYEADKVNEANALSIVKNGNVSYPNKANIKWGIVAQSETIKANNVLYQTPSFLCFDAIRNMYLTHRFYVKLKRKEDFVHLQVLINQYNAEIEKEGDFPLWYIIRCGLNSQYNALELANIFYESGLFAECEPEFVNTSYLDCVNDPKFYNQWNLKNIGQNFIWNNLVDINYCDAHSITSGNSSVIIGVYDRGIELTHPDIHIHSFSYDANTETSPSTIYYDNNHNLHYHGTACAGIIGAKTNNNLGVAGIASDCPIMSLSFDSLCAPEKIGLGFKVAADNGCSVISNSWYVGAYSPYINEGISYALLHGRNGKGCVVVFAAGNENNNIIDYPANSNDSIIVVGAMSPCGERKNPYSCDYENWGSNFGLKLDVMAPGVEIPTTDLSGTIGDDPTDYMLTFRGTSSACPHVAAVAGLILSINPYLTQKEVVDIIESTTQKVGNYTYATHINRPNGTWNDSVGYGLIDAYAAVMEAQNRIPVIQGPSHICIGDTVCFQLLNAPENATFSWTKTAPPIQSCSYVITQGQGTSSIWVTAKKTAIGPKNHHLEADEEMEMQDSCLQFSPPFNQGSVSVNVTTSNATYSITKNTHSPQGQVPTIEASSSGTWFSGTTRFFTVTNNTSAPVDSLHWQIVDVLFDPVNGNDTSIYYDIGRTINYTPYVPPTYLRFVTISVTNTFEACTEQSSSITFGVTNGHLILSAQPVNSHLNVSIFEETEDGQRALVQLDENSKYTLELSHSIYGLMRSKQAYYANEQIDISSLPQGVYVLLLKENGVVIAQTKVKIQ